jgi:hypothetical protein
VWLRLSLAALTVALVTGCSSNSKPYNAVQVADALRNHGFYVSVVAQADTHQELRQVFPQVVPEGVLNVVAARDGQVRVSPGNKADLVLSALIFKTEDKASCDEANLIGTCVRRRNVVVIVRAPHAGAARQALDDLN